MMFTTAQIAALLPRATAQSDLLDSGVALAAIDRAVKAGAVRRYGVQAGAGARIELVRA